VINMGVPRMTITTQSNVAFKQRVSTSRNGGVVDTIKVTSISYPVSYRANDSLFLLLLR